MRADDALVPLTLKSEICETPENVRTNIRATLSQPYDSFYRFLQPAHSGSISIVGSGPSIHDKWQEMTGDVFACNAAVKFLLGKGIVPKYAMYWDAHPLTSKVVTAHKDITYFVASRCPRSVFEQLKDCKVVVWHAGGDECLEPLLNEFNHPEPIINGGSAAVVRAMFMVYAMGYRDMHLFGCDSSHAGETTHFEKSVAEEEEIQVFCDHEWFRTTPWGAMQAEDFKLIGPALRGAGSNIVVHASGLLPHVAKSLGFLTT